MEENKEDSQESYQMDGRHMYEPVSDKNLIFIEAQEQGDRTQPIVIYEEDDTWYLRTYPLWKN